MVRERFGLVELAEAGCGGQRNEKRKVRAGADYTRWSTSLLAFRGSVLQQELETRPLLGVGSSYAQALQQRPDCTLIDRQLSPRGGLICSDPLTASNRVSHAGVE